MKPDTKFVGVREGAVSTIFVVTNSRCVYLADHLAHLTAFDGVRYDWGLYGGNGHWTAVALLTAASNRLGMAGQIAEDFLADVVNQLEHEGWELSAGTVTQYIELWVTCQARQSAKRGECYGCGDR